jgi:hypothetical protein
MCYLSWKEKNNKNRPTQPYKFHLFLLICFLNISAQNAPVPAKHVIVLDIACAELHMNLTEFFPTVDELSSVDVRFYTGIVMDLL